MEVQRLHGSLFDALKKEKAEHKTKSGDSSDKKPEPNLTLEPEFFAKI